MTKKRGWRGDQIQHRHYVWIASLDSVPKNKAAAARRRMRRHDAPICLTLVFGRQMAFHALRWKGITAITEGKGDVTNVAAENITTHCQNRHDSRSRMWSTLAGFTRRFSSSFAAFAVRFRMLVMPHLPQYDSKLQMASESEFHSVSGRLSSTGPRGEPPAHIFVGWDNYKQGADGPTITSKTPKSWHGWVGTEDLDNVGETRQLSLLWNFSQLLRRISFPLDSLCSELPAHMKEGEQVDFKPYCGYLKNHNYLLRQLLLSHKLDNLRSI